MFRVFIAKAAARDLREEASFHRLQETGLAERLKAEFAQVRGNLGKLPYMYPVHRNSIRRAGLASLPYSVFYEVIDDSFVQVVAVYHQSRNPASLETRLDQSSD